MISLILGLHDVICYTYICAFMIHEERTAVVAFAFRPNPEGLILQHRQQWEKRECLMRCRGESTLSSKKEKVVLWTIVFNQNIYSAITTSVLKSRSGKENCRIKIDKMRKDE